MVTYLDKVLYLYPNIQGVVYWHERNPMADSDDPYERLLWENKDIPKPSREDLDNVTDEQIAGKKEQDTKASAVSNFETDKTLSVIYELLIDLKSKVDTLTTEQAKAAVDQVIHGKVTVDAQVDPVTPIVNP